MIDIPFGNSDFQIIHFVLDEFTPERAVRKVLLQLDKKQTALAEHKFRKKKRDIRRREIKKKLNKATAFTRERLELELEQINYYEEREKKLLDDCLHEIALYKNILKKLPSCNREQFEAAELGYWQKRLINDAKNEIIQNGRINKDTLSSLEKIGIKPIKENNQIIFKNYEAKTQITSKTRNS